MLFQYYEYILAISKYHSISRAAKELYVSQPTLSRAVTRLEEELGVTLLDRSRTPITLTPAGECYLHYAEEMLVSRKKMLQELSDLHPEKKQKITIGFPFTYACDFLPYVLPQFYAQYPNVSLSIQEMSGGLLEENLLNHTLDLAIIAGNSFSSDLQCEYLETQRILLIVPKGHPLYYEMEDMNYATLDMVTMQKLNNEPFILLAPNEGMRLVSDHFFQTYHITPRVILEVQDTAAAYSLAASGLGLTLISELRALLKPPNISSSKYCCYQLGNPPYTRTRVIAYPKDIPLSSAEDYLINLSRQNVGEIFSQAVKNAGPV